MQRNAYTTCRSLNADDRSRRGAAVSCADERAARSAFSLIELLIVVAIIAILIALIVVGLRRVQLAAARTESVNALRQMIGGYHGYSGDNNGALMPGYVDFSKLAAKHPLFHVNARLPSEEWIVPPQPQGNPKYFPEHDNLNSYVWRLSPYLAHNWRTMMIDYRDSAAIAYFTSQYDQEIYGPADDDAVATIASAPSFGLNSIFFGGDSRHTNFDFTPTHDDWNNPDNEPKRAATRASQVRNASTIVFGPAGMAGAKSTIEEPYVTISGITQTGYPELRPPYLDHAKDEWGQEQWRFPDKSARPVLQPGFSGPNAGLPITRRGPRDRQYPAAFYDGSASMVDIVEIANDMRFWSPFQTGIAPPSP